MKNERLAMSSAMTFCVSATYAFKKAWTSWGFEFGKARCGFAGLVALCPLLTALS
jgi:hypothetical protein